MKIVTPQNWHWKLAAIIGIFTFSLLLLLWVYVDTRAAIAEMDLRNLTTNMCAAFGGECISWDDYVATVSPQGSAEK